MATIEELTTRLEELERAYKAHLGPQPGVTSLNTPHAGVPYLNSSHELDLAVIPTGTASTEVALGNHVHLNTGWYL